MMTAFKGSLFQPATWQPCDASDFPESPYPGARPVGSWRFTPTGILHGLQHCVDGWVDRCSGEVISVADRHLVLGYGSNLNPSKLASKYRGEEVFVLRSAVVGWAAAWCNARRSQGDVVATLVPAPGHVEVHGVIAVTREQLQEMDRWEGHPQYYERQRLAGTVLVEHISRCSDLRKLRIVQVSDPRSPRRPAAQKLSIARSS